MRQDDKGLVALCAVGAPPSAPRAGDAARGALAALEAVAALGAAGVRASAGVATGAAYVGFVGTQRRREMCLLGSTINTAARLMAHAAAGSVLVDAATRARSATRVSYAARGSVVVKGRDASLDVFEPLGPLGDAQLSPAPAAEKTAAVAKLLRRGGHRNALLAMCGGAAVQLPDAAAAAAAAPTPLAGQGKEAPARRPAHVQMLAKVWAFVQEGGGGEGGGVRMRGQEQWQRACGGSGSGSGRAACGGSGSGVATGRGRCYARSE